VQAIAGVATFTDLSVDKPGADYALGCVANIGSIAYSERFSVALFGPVAIVRTIAPVVLDGIASRGEWIGASPIALGSVAQDVLPGAWDGPDDYTASVRLKWDVWTLSFFLDVHDDAVSFPATSLSDAYSRDGLEMFLGLDTSASPNRRTYAPGDFQLVITADDTTTGFSGVWYSPQAPDKFNGPSPMLVARRTSTGYALEGDIPWATLTPLFPIALEGRIIGFNLMGKDNDTAQPAEQSAFSLSGLPRSSTGPAYWTTAILNGIPAIYGDVNTDGQLNMRDVMHIIAMGAGLASGTNLHVADVAPSPSGAPRGFGDGRVDLRDALRVLRFLQGFEPGWP